MLTKDHEDYCFTYCAPKNNDELPLLNSQSNLVKSLTPALIFFHVVWILFFLFLGRKFDQQGTDFCNKFPVVTVERLYYCTASGCKDSVLSTSLTLYDIICLSPDA